MKKIYSLLFILVFIPLATYSQNTSDSGWLAYDVQTQKTTDITIPTNIAVETTIVGTDNRIEITGKANGYQRASIVLKTERGQCSGALVGRNIVLTAAHCVIMKGEFATNVKILAPGVQPHVSAQGIEIIVPKKFAKYYDGNYGNLIVQTHDYAFVILNTLLGDKLGYFGTKRYSVLQLLNEQIRVLGRGGDKAFETLWISDGKVGLISLFQPGPFIDYNADAIHGNSGGPVVLSDDPTYIIAIHTSDWYVGKYPNEGLLVTRNLERMLFQLRERTETAQQISDNLKRSFYSQQIK